MAGGGQWGGVITLRLFDLEAPPGAEPIALTRTDTDFYGAVSFDSSAQWLATTHSKQGTALWWLGGARPSVLALSWAQPREIIRDLAFTPDGRWPSP